MTELQDRIISSFADLRTLVGELQTNIPKPNELDKRTIDSLNIEREILLKVPEKFNHEEVSAENDKIKDLMETLRRFYFDLGMLVNGP